MIPQRIDPRTLRACSAAVTSNPKKNTSRSGDARCAFNFTAVPESFKITPASCKPMNAMNSPIPTAMPFFMLGLTASKIISRSPSSDRIKNSTPEMKTAPSAACQPSANPAAVAAGIAENTKKKFCPIPGASRGWDTARIHRWRSPSLSAADKNVAVVTAPKSIPVLNPNIAPDNTAGCTKMM